MNYDQPRQLADLSGWRYTSMNDGRVHATGYCRDHDAHPTEDEARRCYRDYELNERLMLDGTLGSWNPCDYPACETLTNRAARIAGWTKWRLCDVHRTKETCAELYGEMAGDSAHS